MDTGLNCICGSEALVADRGGNRLPGRDRNAALFLFFYGILCLPNRRQCSLVLRVGTTINSDEVVIKVTFISFSNSI